MATNLNRDHYRSWPLPLPWPPLAMAMATAIAMTTIMHLAMVIAMARTNVIVIQDHGLVMAIAITGIAMAHFHIWEYIRLVLQTSLENFLSVNFDQFLDLDGPYFALLGPLLAPPASGLTPSTCRNLVSTRPKQIFDQKYFRDF